MKKNSITIQKKLQKPKPTVVFDTYWKFAKERQEIFFNRLEGKESWTDDPILQRHKFTNAYRASDRVSQYLIKEVIYKGSRKIEEVFFRIIVFKTFNKVETWEYLKGRLGEISYASFSFTKYANILSELSEYNAIYSGAYIMASGKSIFGFDKKYQNHLRLIEVMMKDKLPNRVAKEKSMNGVFSLLKEYPTIGTFLAFQYTIDINYSEITHFDEMDFVEPGPGALDGITKCFYDLGDFSERDIIKFVADQQDIEFERLGLEFKSLWGRPLQLIDCQNLFCEVDKYARVAHPEAESISNRKRIKQLFNPKQDAINYWYPPKWEINDKINSK